MRVLDAGCGSGRNLVYFLMQGYDVFGVDTDPQAVEQARRLAASLAPALSADNFRVEAIEAMSFPDAFADLVLSSAVLHFARAAFLPPGIFYWNGTASPTHSGTPLPFARRLAALPG
jgi:SAM-dependent methyltransferase